ncbi:MAG: hypothetical protein QME96_13660 [Myxococcota bacterium]|nr:hypothetical protein [Myxococcota bacterium]
MTRAGSLAALAVAACLAGAGCDLTLTRDRPSYEDLSAIERAAVDRILARLRAFDVALRRDSMTGIRREYSLGPVAEDRDRIDVSFRGLWIATNIGDDVIHISVWENLSSAQRAEWASWFGEAEAAAKVRYEEFFYDWVAAHLAGIQAVFRIQTVEYVYGRRSVFKLERDGQRLAASYARVHDTGLLSRARSTCGPIRDRFASRWGNSFTQEYYLANFRSLTDPAMPSGWIYFLCRHMAEAEVRGVDLIGRPYTFADELSVIPRESR